MKQPSISSTRILPIARRAPITRMRASIVEEHLILVPFNPYLLIPGVREIVVKNPLPKRIVGLIGNYFVSNLIQGLRVVLQKV